MFYATSVDKRIITKDCTKSAGTGPCLNSKHLSVTLHSFNKYKMYGNSLLSGATIKLSESCSKLVISVTEHLVEVVD